MEGRCRHEARMALDIRLCDGLSRHAVRAERQAQARRDGIEGGLRGRLVGACQARVHGGERIF